MKKYLAMLVCAVGILALTLSGCLLEKFEGNVSVDKVDTKYDGAGALLSPTD